MAKPAGSNVGEFEPLQPRPARGAGRQDRRADQRPCPAQRTGRGAGLRRAFCDLSVDAETGIVTIGRYTAVQDVGTAIHPCYVEGQIQGGAVQGIGWALNEEYIYNAKGQLENPGFLDYRMPVASDLPMIETILVEVPNPRIPTACAASAKCRSSRRIAAVGNAISRAIGIRMTDLPMSPPKLSRGDRRGGAADGGGLKAYAQAFLPFADSAKGRCPRLTRAEGSSGKGGPFYIGRFVTTLLP